jgi:hypothetical protein
VIFIVGASKEALPGYENQSEASRAMEGNMESENDEL